MEVDLTSTRRTAKIKQRTHTSRHFGLDYSAAWYSLSAPQENAVLARACSRCSQSCQREEVAAILRHSKVISAEPRGNAKSPRLISQGRALNQVIITMWQKKIKSIIFTLLILKVPGLANQLGGKNPQNLKLTLTHLSMQWYTSVVKVAGLVMKLKWLLGSEASFFCHSLI